ncbi:MAG: flagellar export protein FliJ [Deltaproteobacteria bacterium]|jgi:flagellar export protein FliJ|nr:flagellar export protein FliJ [Deltaproteobacteria bacterium]
MPAFKFRLDFLVTLRRQREEEAALKLSRRLASLAELEEKIQSLWARINEMATEVKTLGQIGRLTGPLVRLYGEYQGRLRQDLKKAEELLVLSRREEAKERQALIQAITAREAIEKTRDRQKENFILEDRRTEQNNLEEMAQIARARRLKQTVESDEAS